MAMLLYLIMAAVLCAAFYLTADRRPWKRRAGLLDDAEKLVAMIPQPGQQKESSFPTNARAEWDEAEMKTLLEADQHAASAQLLSEFVAASDKALKAVPNAPMGYASLPSRQSSLGEPVVFVNPKQYHRILKRRISRQAWAEALRSKKAQGRTLRRSRVAHVDGVLVGVS